VQDAGRPPSGCRAVAPLLDDITAALRRCVNPALSRSAIHRCLQRHGLSARLALQEDPDRRL
jgi:hypothetical protein